MAAKPCADIEELADSLQISADRLKHHDPEASAALSVVAKFTRGLISDIWMARDGDNGPVSMARTLGATVIILQRINGAIAAGREAMIALAAKLDKAVLHA